ncbi:MAG: hypothetical protein GX974_08265, partial [Clostridiales bacterium]|nr:hypothetical protein [Clostridiales bacterium]
NLDMWTMEAFSTRYSQADLGNIDADLLYKDGKIIGDIKNSTDYPLEDVVVLTNVGYYKVGNLAAGAKRDVEFDAVTPTTMPHYPDSIKYSLMDDIFPYDEDINYAKRRLIDDILPLPERMANVLKDVSTSEVGLEAIIFGFNDQRIDDDINIDGKPANKTYRTNLFMDRTQIGTSTDGKVVILPGMIMAKIDPEISENLEQYEMMGDMNEIYLYNSRKVAFYFDMEDFSQIDIDSLKIYIDASDGKFAGDMKVPISLYNRDGDSFVEGGEGLDIDLDSGIIDIDPAYIEKYTDHRGRLYIMIGLDEDSQQDVMVGFPSISAEGRRR